MEHTKTYENVLVPYNYGPLLGPDMEEQYPVYQFKKDNSTGNYLIDYSHPLYWQNDFISVKNPWGNARFWDSHIASAYLYDNKIYAEFGEYKVVVDSEEQWHWAYDSSKPYHIYELLGFKPIVEKATEGDWQRDPGYWLWETVKEGEEYGEQWYYYHPGDVMVLGEELDRDNLPEDFYSNNVSMLPFPALIFLTEGAEYPLVYNPDLDAIEKGKDSNIKIDGKLTVATSIESPLIKSPSILRVNGNREDPVAVKDKDAEWDKAGAAPIGYDKTNDTLVPLKDMSLNSINVVDRIVVEGISYLNGDVIADKNVSVHGDLIVDGTTYTTEEQSLDTTSDYVVLRHSNPSGLSNTEKAGIVVNNYNGTKHAALAVDNDGIWRVSDNETESTTTYTNFSKFGDVYYEGFDQTTTKQVITNGATVSRDADELSDCVWYDGHYYYHDNVDWFLLSLTANRMVFDVDSPITDSSLINTLNGLTKANLEYYRSVTILTISDTQIISQSSHKCYVEFNGKAYAKDTGNQDYYWVYFTSQYEVTPETATPNKEPAWMAGSNEDYWVWYDGYYWTRELDGSSFLWENITGFNYSIGRLGYYWDRRLDPDDPDDAALIETLEALPRAAEVPVYIDTEWTERVENNQPLLTRAESEDLTDGAPLVWDSNNNKAITTATTDGNKVLKSVKDTATGKVTYEWSSSGSGAVWVGTSAQLQQALLIVDPNDERYIPDNAMLIVTDEESYVEGEEQE